MIYKRSDFAQKKAPLLMAVAFSSQYEERQHAVFCNLKTICLDQAIWTALAHYGRSNYHFHLS